jgi:hypothetical protein
MSGVTREMDITTLETPRGRTLMRGLMLGILFSFVFAIGCGGGSSGSPQHHHSPTPTATPTPTPPPPGVAGVVFGGAPSVGSSISGAAITLYQAGAGGYGAGAVQLTQVSSQSDGSFNIPSVTCNSSGLSQQIYLVATGGTISGQSSPNSAIALSAALGSCAIFEHSIVINEATTVATAWALNQFMDATGQNVGTSATNQIGLGNAVNLLPAMNFVDLTTGLAPTTIPDGLTSPTATLYTLANILAGCVNSPGASSTGCQNLFTAATPPAGSAPTTTLQAALDIVRNPVNNVNGLFALVPSNPPFTPDLTSAPASWVAEVNYSAASAEFLTPSAVALDAAGNVWVANGGGNSVSELTALSGYISALNFAPSGAILQLPTSLAFDAQGNLWVSNFSGSSVGELTAASGYTTGLNFAPSAAVLNNPYAIALDAAGNLWASNFTGNSVSELLAGCSATSCTGANFNNSNTGSPGAGFNNPISLVPDAAGDVWVANYAGNSISELPAGCSSSACTAANFNNSNTGSPGALFNNPIEVTLDSSANVWAVNLTGNSATELPAGCTVSSCTAANINNSNTGSPGAMFSGPNSLVLDPSSNLWVTNETGNTLSEVTAISDYALGINFGPWAAFRSQFFVAGDAAGNLWIANNYDSSVTQVVGIATPILTPDEACLALGGNSCSP